MSKRNENAAWGLISVIVTELVAAPGILGGGTYFLSGLLVRKWGLDQTVQIIVTLFAALLGLGIAFYRINQISNKMDGPP